MRGAHWTERRIEGLRRRARRHTGFSGRAKFTDRASGSHSVVLVLAGYKEWLWPYTLDRLPRVAPDDVDICLVSAGKQHPGLEAMAEEHGWSYLWSPRNSVALVHNLGVESHPEARWVFKLDEDILLPDGYFATLHDGYRRIVGEGMYHPGFCAPVLNVNGFSYLTFLETMGLSDEYRSEFGELRRAIDGNAIYANAAAARWIWERTLPFDAVARRFAEQEFAYSTVPHRFSIGAILYERAFWEEIGGIFAHPIAGRLGADEADLCRQCEHRSRPMAVIHNVLAGHFSFWPQEGVMRELLDERPGDFAYAPAPARL
jgi:hypothetical protein